MVINYFMALLCIKIVQFSSVLLWLPEPKNLLIYFNTADAIENVMLVFWYSIAEYDKLMMGLYVNNCDGQFI